MTSNHRRFYEDFHTHAPEMNRNEILKEQTRMNVLKELMRSQDKGRIAVAGCGAGRDVTVVERKLIAFDLSYAAVKRSQEAHGDNSYFVASISCIPLKDGVINCVVCSEVIEHTAEPERAMREFQRVLRRGGTLVLTTPNWISWYGLARKIVEWVTRTSITAAHQPIDHWYTPRSLRRLVEPYFKVKKWRGIWYYPPIGRRDALLPIAITYFFMSILHPVNLLLSRLLPGLGHCLGIVCQKNISSGRIETK